jgi:hypothetical protein
MAWVVVRSFNDGYETWDRDVAEFDTEAEAEQFADAEERSEPTGVSTGVWFRVDFRS